MSAPVPDLFWLATDLDCSYRDAAKEARRWRGVSNTLEEWYEGRASGIAHAVYVLLLAMEDTPRHRVGPCALDIGSGPRYDAGATVAASAAQRTPSEEDV